MSGIDRFLAEAAEPDPEGDFVRFDDHLEALQAQRNERVGSIAEVRGRLRVDHFDQFRQELILWLGSARQACVRPTSVEGDLFGNVHDPDHAEAERAERRAIHGVQVVAIADVEAALKRILERAEGAPAPEPPRTQVGPHRYGRRPSL